MSMKKIASVFTLAAAFAVSMQAPSASALTCTPTAPTAAAGSLCSGGGVNARGIATTNGSGTTWTYSVNMGAGISSSARLVASDGVTAIKNTAGFNCPTATDGTANGVKGSNQSCSTLAFAPKRLRILVG